MSLSLDGVCDMPSPGLQDGAKQESCRGLIDALYGPSGGIAAALKSVASLKTWDGVPDVTSQMSPLQLTGRGSHGMTREADSPPLAQVETAGEGGNDRELKAESEMEAYEMPSSKYIRVLPLYQDYCLRTMRAEMHRLQGGSLSELVASVRLSRLQSQSSPGTQSIPRRHPQNNIGLLWQDLPEVQEQGLLNTLTSKERRHQEAMFELIGSEASYLKSLTVAVSHFRDCQQLRQSIPTVEHHILFSNLVDVKTISERFLLALEARLEESIVLQQIGDLVLGHRTSLQSVYVPYITNMMYQEALIKRLTTENRTFVHVLKKLEKAPVCQRQSLKSFLVLPFQRVTRMRIILENILHLTPERLEAVGPVKEAIAAVHQILTDCDERVQRMKQTEILLHLEKVMDFKKVKSIPLISRGRCLLHEGPLRQAVVRTCPSGGSPLSYKNIYLHLFNDLLLLSHRREERFSVLDYAPFPAHIQVEQVKSGMLGLPPNSFLLHFKKNSMRTPTVFILSADTGSAREMWIRVLVPQQSSVTNS